MLFSIFVWRKILIFVGCFFVLPAKATTFFPVDETSLKAAITTANSNGQADTIDLGNLSILINTPQASPNGLSPIEPDGGNRLVIQNGTLVRSSTSDMFRFFEVLSGANLSLIDVNLRNGNVGSGLSGGAIIVDGGGNLSLVDDSRFESNTAGAMGGAIAFLASSIGGTIDDTTFTNNSASLGGGAISILDASVTNLFDLTLDHNSTPANGGAILVSTSTADASIAAIRNSTLSDNSAANGGGIYLAGDATHQAVITNFTNSTLAGNTSTTAGGGLYLASTGSIDSLMSNIIALNTAPTGPDINDMSSISSESNNLIGNNSGSDITAGNPNANNSFVGTAAVPVNPLLGKLANNGGSIKTRRLLRNSPAIDTGTNPASLIFDQRGEGFPRSRDGLLTDIGAFELQECPDEDSDGSCDTDDLCPLFPNSGQIDGDEDGIGDICDNCPDDENEDQSDEDEDGMGDECDFCPFDPLDDADQDGICADEDNCPFAFNPDQSDIDADGLGDRCDTIPAAATLAPALPPPPPPGPFPPELGPNLGLPGPFPIDSAPNIDGALEPAINIAEEAPEGEIPLSTGSAKIVDYSLQNQPNEDEVSDEEALSGCSTIGNTDISLLALIALAIFSHKTVRRRYR